jgi:hypothetical protein
MAVSGLLLAGAEGFGYLEIWLFGSDSYLVLRLCSKPCHLVLKRMRPGPENQITK